eukprot:4232449-Prymnesium_polylepis.1
MSLKAAASRAPTLTGARGVTDEVVDGKTKHTRMRTFTGWPAMRKEGEGERCADWRLCAIVACRLGIGQIPVVQGTSACVHVCNARASPLRVARTCIPTFTPMKRSSSGGSSPQPQHPSVDQAQERHSLGQVPEARTRRPSFRAVAAPEGPAFAMEGPKALFGPRLLRGFKPHFARSRSARLFWAQPPCLTELVVGIGRERVAVGLGWVGYGLRGDTGRAQVNSVGCCEGRLSHACQSRAHQCDQRSTLLRVGASRTTL